MLHRWNHLAFVLLISCVGCHAHLTPVHLTAGNTPFGDLFTLTDSTYIDASRIEGLIYIYPDAKDNFYLCDYTGRKLCLYDAKGNFVKDVLTVHSVPGKTFGAPICITIFPPTGDLYVADNKFRRIFVLDSTGSFKKAFIISGNHMTPVDMTFIGDKLVMAGVNKNSHKFLHMYDTSGRYIRSFFTGTSPLHDEEYVHGALNYVWVGSGDHQLYATELMNYSLLAFDTTGKTEAGFQIQPDYFRPLTQELLHSIKTDFQDIRESFSKPSTLQSNGHYVVVQVDMPTQAGTSDDYYLTRNYRLDIFDHELKPLHTGIVCGRKKLFFLDKNNTCYFITKLDTAHHFAIEKYSFKG